MAKAGSLAALDKMPPAWRTIIVRLKFTVPGSPLRGTRPADPTVTQAFLERRIATDAGLRELLERAKNGPPGALGAPRSIEQMAADEATRLPKREEIDLEKSDDETDPLISQVVVFHRSPDAERRLQVDSIWIRSHLKTILDAAIPQWKKALGDAFPPQFAARFKAHCYSMGRFAPGDISTFTDVLTLDGKPWPDAPEVYQGPAQVANGFGGTRPCLKMIEQIQDCMLQFCILWADDGWIEDAKYTAPKLLQQMLNRGCMMGMGGDRNQGCGKYDWEVIDGDTVLAGGVSSFAPAVPVVAQD